MAFPTSPTNGQQANINGITYTYSSAATAWTVSTSVSNTFVSINVSDNVNSGNVLATGVISATGNVSGGNLVMTGNIVDTGALTIVTGSNGNITLSPNGTGIVAATGAISTTGNISANNATFTSNQTLSYGTANGVIYLNSNKVATSGTALTFDGTNILSLAPGGAAIVNLGATTSYGVVTGTGTNPAAIYFNGATRTSFGSYLQYGATNHVFLNETLGSEIMRLLNTGNVGIGTSSPTSRLHVSHPSAATNAIAQFTNGTTGVGVGNGLYVGIDTSNEATVFNFYNSALKFGTNGSERMRLDASGNLGIGTTTPSTGKFSDAAYAFLIQSASTTNGTNIFASNSDNSKFVGFWSGHSSAEPAVGVKTGNAFTFGKWGTINGTGGFTENMRLDSSGNLLVNTTGNIFGSRLAVVGAYPQVAGSFETNNSTYAAISCYASQGNYPADQISFYSNVSSTVTFVGKITSTTNSVNYGSGSDYRLKNTITPMTGALAKVALLNPVAFKWNVDGSDGEGFIAHELQAVIPIAVSGEKDEIDKNGKPRYQTVDTSFLVATLTAAIQEQQALITQLTARITALEGA